MKALIIIVTIAVLLIGGFFTYNQFIKTPNPCEGIGVMFLKPSEVNLTRGILQRNPNTIIIIPETNEIRGNSKTLLCPNLPDLNVFDYLN